MRGKGGYGKHHGGYWMLANREESPLDQTREGFNEEGASAEELMFERTPFGGKRMSIYRTLGR